MNSCRRPEILAYYFPNWHVDPRNEQWHGQGWTEWNVSKYATPRFPGHHQPKVPLWGYEDEADPAVMAKKIETAASYGIDGFIFDWYFYADGPYRNRCLEEGLLRAANLSKTKFAVMWCNHDAIQAHPGSRAFPSPVLCSGVVNAETFRNAIQHCIEHYFSSPSYLRVDGKLYFSIYNLAKMVNELGGESPARALFDECRSRVRQAGLGELHLNAVHVGYRYENNHPNSAQLNASLAAVGLDSRSGHSWSWHSAPDCVCVDYGIAAEQNMRKYQRLTRDFNLPYNPVVLVGWDPSPRTVQSEIYANLGKYPFNSILSGSTPAQFEKNLREARAFLKSDAFQGNFLLLHSWNEWTEGTYLEPDEENRFGYLEAIRNVFGVSH